MGCACHRDRTIFFLTFYFIQPHHTCTKVETKNWMSTTETYLLSLMSSNSYQL